MEHITATILYLSIYRVGMISAGVVSIVIGYRLFSMGFTASTKISNNEVGTISGEFAGVKLAIVNTAPGTAFALFGVIIIGLQLIHGGPEAIIKYYESGQLDKASLRGDANGNAANAIEGGQEIVSIAELSAKALELLENNPGAAEKTVTDLLSSWQPEINNLAWVLAQTSPEMPYAIPLAELALSLNPNDPDTIHTAAVMSYANGDRDRAIDLLRRSVDLRATPILQQIEKWQQEKMK